MATLLQDSSDLNVSDPEIGRPALYALVTGKRTGMLISHPGKEDVLALEALLKHKVDVNTKDTKGFRVRRHFLHLPDNLE